MPHKPKPAQQPDADYHIVLRVPGWFKNEVIELAATNGVSLNQWLLAAVRKAALEQQGVPDPPQARAPLPTTLDQIRAYTEGSKLVLPCGKIGDSCAGTLEPTRMGTHLYCPECNIRVQ